MLTRTLTNPPVPATPTPAPAVAQIVAEIPAPSALLGGRWHGLHLPQWTERRALVPAPRRARPGLPNRLALAAEDALCDLWGSLVERRGLAEEMTCAWSDWLSVN